MSHLELQPAGLDEADGSRNAIEASPCNIRPAVSLWRIPPDPDGQPFCLNTPLAATALHGSVSIW